MSELSEHAILWNTAALTSLKRAQLTSLSKRYGLRANGKNAELVQRLYDYGQTLTPSAKDAFDMAAAATVEHESPTKSDGAGPAEPLAPPPARSGIQSSRPSTRSLARSGSDAWEVLDNSDASLIEEEEELASEGTSDAGAIVTTAEAPSSSTRTWKSADNGAPLDDFAHRDQRYGSLRGVGSLRSIASSIRRTASRTLSAQHKAERSPAPAATPSTVFPAMADAGVTKDDMEEVLQASPASTVGVPKRLRKYQSEHHRPSTIRVVSPAPSLHDPEVEHDELPLTGKNSVDRIKQRVSSKPMRDGHSHPPVSIRNRRSIPVLMSPATTSTPSIYPPIPVIDPTAPPEIQRAMAECSPEPEIPGSFPTSPADNVSPTSPSFVFGSRQAVTNTEFSDAGSKLLAEFQAKMGGSGANLFSTELLKGKDAEFERMAARRAASGRSTIIPSASTSGKPGFGLAPGPEMATDRYAESHRREFARMKSLQSVNERKVSDSSMKSAKAAGKRKLDAAAEPSEMAVSTSPTETAPTVDRDNKRVKPAPAAKPSIIDSFRRSRASSKSPAKPPARSLTKSLGFLRGHRKTPSMLAADSPLKQSAVPAVPKMVSPKKAAVDDSSVRSKTSVVKKSSPSTVASRESSQPSSLASRKSTIRLSAPPRRALGGDFGPSKPSFEPLKDSSYNSATRSSIAKASAPPTASSHSVRPSASVSSSLSRSPGTHHLAHMASGEFGGFSTTRRDLSASRSPSMSRMSASASGIPRSRSSTLFAPTASSLARRQATLKPPADKPSVTDKPTRRPLPVPPNNKAPKPTMLGSSVVTYPFGEASSRTNYHLFDSAFHSSPQQSPFNKSAAALGASSPSVTASGSTSTLLAKTPGKSSTPGKRPLPHTPKTGKSPMSPARQRSIQQRARKSGLSSIKASPAPDGDVARRRADLRAKQQRLGEERSLMRMLE